MNIRPINSTLTMEAVFSSERRRHYANLHGAKNQEQIQDQISSLFIIIIIIILTENGFLVRGSGTTIRHNT
jgi:hypothetical protein